MQEKDLNTIINNNFKRFGFSHKISDPVGGVGSQNPFDGFSVMQGTVYFWETKLLKEFKALNFKRIEEHQYESLTTIRDQCPECLCFVIAGIWIPRQCLELYLFDIDLLNWLRVAKKSILQKELLRLREAKMMLPVIKKEFDVLHTREAIIDETKWNEAIP